MKAVIVFYSLEGNTELIANMIAKEISADTVKLLPEKEIPKSGFKKFFWGGKSAIFKEKPHLLNDSISLEQYDTIIIGTPVWAGTFAPPINTFLSDNSIKNKNIYLIACSSGGGVKKCFDNIEHSLSGNKILGTADFIDPVKGNKGEIEEKVHAFCEKIKSSN